MQIPHRLVRRVESEAMMICPNCKTEIPKRKTGRKPFPPEFREEIRKLAQPIAIDAERGKYFRRTQQDIADIMGTSRKTVRKVLRESCDS